MEALAAASSSSSSSSPPIFHASLANFVSMETVFVRKPFRNRAEQEEVIQDAIETGQDMLKIPASAPPTVKYHISYGFILLELTGTPAWIKAALALAKSRYWKMEKSIRISKTVKIKPYLKKGDYDEEEPNLNRGPVEVYLHGPDSLRPSWMNLPPVEWTVEPIKGKVSEHAKTHYRAEHPDDALSFAARNSSTRRDRIYHEEAAFNKGMEYQREAAAIYAEAYKAGLIKGAAAASRSNAAGGSGMGGGNRRKTRKHRK